MSKPSQPSTPSSRRKAAADVYRKAARLMEREREKGSEFSCDRIGEVCGVWRGPFADKAVERARYGLLKSAYEKVFRPRRAGIYWGRQWGEHAHDCRILALCFMASITERP